MFFGSKIEDGFAASKNSAHKKESPTRIRSDSIDIKRKSQTIDFLGNVVVEKEDSSMLAQKMTIFYNENEEEGSSINKINATDNVKIFSKEFIATGDLGYFDPKKDIFILEKNVVVNNGTSIGSGDKFIYNLKTKKGNFVGKKDEKILSNDKRVVVVIGNDIKDEKKKKKSKD